MKVVILSNDFRVYWKGRLIFLEKYLAGRDITFSAVELFGKGSPYDFDTVNTTARWWKCLFPDKSAAELTTGEISEALFNTLDELNPDIVVATAITFFAGALGLRWAKQHRKKFIMFDDARPLKQFKRNLIVQTVKNLLISQADALWVPMKDYDAEYPFVNKQNTGFIYGYSSIDNDLFGLKGSKKFTSHKIVCVARLVPVKNLDKLLKAWHIVEGETTTYSLVIAGDGPLLNTLTELATELELKNVSFVGAISPDSLPAFYHDADAFILPSLSETWGLVVNEAMAASLPVLLSNKVNAAQSLVNDGVDGFCFSPYVHSSIAHAIMNFINLNETEKENMAAAALKTISALSYEKMGEQLEEGFKKVAAKKFRKPGLIAQLLMNRWSGAHNTSAWDNLQKV